MKHECVLRRNNWIFLTILADMYAWLVIFVLPLNSAVNPLLYTFTTPKYRNQIKNKRWCNGSSVAIIRKKGNLVNSNQGNSIVKNIFLTVEPNECYYSLRFQMNRRGKYYPYSILVGKCKWNGGEWICIWVDELI